MVVRFLWVDVIQGWWFCICYLILGLLRFCCLIVAGGYACDFGFDVWFATTSIWLFCFCFGFALMLVRFCFWLLVGVCGLYYRLRCVCIMPIFDLGGLVCFVWVIVLYLVCCMSFVSIFMVWVLA